MAKPNIPTSIDDYIKDFSAEEQQRMQSLREIIREEAPEASEKISWGMPTFYLNGNLVHFAAHKNHLGFYPGESGVANFLPQLSAYKHSKGAIQFPGTEPLPEQLVREIVRFRVKENTAAK